MLEKPDLSDEPIIACLRADFGLPVTQVTFLPLGADLNTAIYRATCDDGEAYFGKLRSGVFDPTSVLLPQTLHEQGVKQIIVPLKTQSGQLWAHLDRFTVVVYPFVEGHSGREVALTEGHWREFGRALKGLHTATLSPDLSGRIREETYSPKWREIVRTFLERIETDVFDDPAALQLAAFLRAKRDEVSDLVRRAGQLAQVLTAQPRERVLCHSDVHGSNVLIGADGAFYIVDWDDPILAPKERDLMYVGGAQGFVGHTAQEQAALFYRGYGRALVDPFALAYYRYERIVEDIAVYCQQLFLTDEGGQDRAQSLKYLKSNFDPDGTIEIAYRSDKTAMRYARGDAKWMIKNEIWGESYTIRMVASAEELAEALDRLGAQFTPPFTHEAPELSKLFDAYPADCRLMLVAEKEGRIVGGVLGSGNVVRIVALEPNVRRKGLGRRLLQTYEVGAMRRGVQTISLGAIEGAKGFYLRMGYHGKSSMHKELPLPGRVLEFRLKKLEARLGDLAVGQVVQTEKTGKVPSLF